MEKKLTTMRIPNELYAELERIAESRRKETGKNVSITELVVEALQEFILLQERGN